MNSSYTPGQKSPLANPPPVIIAHPPDKWHRRIGLPPRVSLPPSKPNQGREEPLPVEHDPFRAHSPSHYPLINVPSLRQRSGVDFPINYWVQHHFFSPFHRGGQNFRPWVDIQASKFMQPVVNLFEHFVILNASS